MLQQTMTIQNKRGLHTRAAAKLVDTAKKFGSRIEVVYHDRMVDCKSIMGVITLGAQKDNRVEIIADGRDEKEALTAIYHLIDSKFGEE